MFVPGRRLTLQQQKTPERVKDIKHDCPLVLVLLAHQRWHCATSTRTFDVSFWDKRSETWCADKKHDHGSIWVNYETCNRYVLMAIGLFGVLLYCGLLYGGLVEFRARISKRNGNKQQSRNRFTARKLRNPKVSGIER